MNIGIRIDMVKNMITSNWGLCCQLTAQKQIILSEQDKNQLQQQKEADIKQLKDQITVQEQLTRFQTIISEKETEIQQLKAQIRLIEVEKINLQQQNEELIIEKNNIKLNETQLTNTIQFQTAQLNNQSQKITELTQLNEQLTQLN